MAHTRGWCDEVHATCADVAHALALPIRRNHLPACPLCGASGSGSGKLLPGDGSGSRRWYCHRCERGGSAIDLVALNMFGRTLTNLSAEHRAQVRRWFVDRRWLTAPTSAPFTRHSRSTEAVPRTPAASQRPCRGQLRAFNATLVSVDVDEEATLYLTSRGVPTSVVVEQRLAKVVPHGAHCPKWAFGAGMRWSEGHRLIFAAYGPTGRVESFRARWCRPEAVPARIPKGLAAAAGTGSATGLALANRTARQMLRRGTLPPAVPLVVVEGELDFLSWAVSPRARSEQLAVLGVWNGSWTEELAARVPVGADVSIRTDNDKAGDKYASAIAAALADRCVVRRKRPVEDTNGHS